MTKFQKAFCAFLSLCFFAVLAFMPEPFYQRGNIYRQFPLYCFLEKKAKIIRENGDWETSRLIVKNNGEYLGKMMQEENREEGERLMREESEAFQGKYVGDNPDGADADDQTGAAGQQVDDGSQDASETGFDDSGQLEADFDVDFDAQSANAESDAKSLASAQAAAIPHPVLDLSPEMLADYDYLMNNFFILDENAATSPDQLNAVRFLKKDLTIEKSPDKPQILIYHSHSQETFIDSREGEPEDTIVGVGDYLTRLLTETYGYQVIHVTEPFDIMEGHLDRSGAYDYAREYVEQVLAENPAIEVIIDLHRDGVSKDRHLVTEIDGKPTAQIMFFNGLSYTAANGLVEYLPNPYIEDNLAFSFQLEYQAAQYYPDLYRGIYLAGLRYNLHLSPKALLLEAGAQTNTLQEVKNAMKPFADILDRVLAGKN